MASANYDISHEQGTDFVLNINYYDDTGTPIDMTQNYWAKLDVRGQRYELDTSDTSLKIRFSTNNDHGYTGYSGETYYGFGGTWAKKIGHISLDGEYVYTTDGDGATSSGVTGQISLSFTKQASASLASGAYLYDLFLFTDRGISTGSTSDALAERLIAGKFIVSPTISNPDFDG